MIPSISHPTDRPNFSVVTTETGTYWFSYSTCIAFQRSGRIIVRANDWGPTTGKHLSEIDGGSADAKKSRLPSAEFESLLTATEVPA